MHGILTLKKSEAYISVMRLSFSLDKKNIISSSSTGFFGRISLELHLEELSLPECNTLLDEFGFRRSNLEKLMTLSL